MVTVKFTASLRRDLGLEKDNIEAPTVADLLAELERRYGEAFKKYRSYCHIFVNGLSTTLIAGPATRLSDGDEVLFLQLVTGG